MCVLEQERVETPFDDHDQKKDGQRLFDILLDIRRTLADTVAMLLFEVLQLNHGRIMMIARRVGIIDLIMAKLILFRFDDFAKVFRVNVSRGAILNEVSNAGRGSAHPGFQPSSNAARALNNFLFAFAPLILGDRFGRRNSICGILLGDLARASTAEAEVAFRKLSLQPVLAQRLVAFEGFDGRLIANVCAPAHRFLVHLPNPINKVGPNINSTKIGAGP